MAACKHNVGHSKVQLHNGTAYKFFDWTNQRSDRRIGSSIQHWSVLEYRQSFCLTLFHENTQQFFHQACPFNGQHDIWWPKRGTDFLGHEVLYSFTVLKLVSETVLDLSSALLTQTKIVCRGLCPEMVLQIKSRKLWMHKFHALMSR